jgi:hypothetical protein
MLRFSRLKRRNQLKETRCSKTSTPWAQPSTQRSWKPRAALAKGSLRRARADVAPCDIRVSVCTTSPSISLVTTPPPGKRDLNGEMMRWNLHSKQLMTRGSKRKTHQSRHNPLMLRLKQLGRRLLRLSANSNSNPRDDARLTLLDSRIA